MEFDDGDRRVQPSRVVTTENVPHMHFLGDSFCTRMLAKAGLDVGRFAAPKNSNMLG
jgi:hypothetical protein